MAIRAKASAILDVPIREGRWISYTNALDAEGKFDRRKMLELIMSLCEEVELLEQKVQLLEDSQAQIPPTRLRDEKGHFIKEDHGTTPKRS